MFEIKQLSMGNGIRPTDMYTYKHNETKKIEAFYGAFLLKNDDYNILVDTGIDAEIYKAISGREILNYTPLEDVLNDNGLTTEDISFVIQTHLHFDHAGNLNAFKDKKIYLQKDEYEYAQNPENKKLYFQSFYSDVNFEIVDGDTEIVSGLKVILTPGHSHGCQSIIVDTEYGTAGIAGFCSILENLVLLQKIFAKKQ